MLVITGIFENKLFIPDEPVTIPQKKRVIVTIEEEEIKESVKSVKHSAYGKLNAYANPSLIPDEKGAWEKATVNKYAHY